jgi:hypothetical protein
MALARESDLSDKQRAILNLVRSRFQASDRLCKQYRDHWNVYYGLYRNYRRLRRQAQQSEPDRDSLMSEFQRVFGLELFIPYVYATIEAEVPRILSNNPRMLVLPGEPAAQESTEPVRKLFDRDQAAIGYELKLQETARSGLMYGLGVQKTYWEREYRSTREVRPARYGDGYAVSSAKPSLVHAGPQAESVDIFDFFWDPAAKNIATCTYLIHRTWRTIEYVSNQVKTGKWEELDLDAVKRMGSSTARGDLWAERMQAAGISDFDPRGGDLHEVWEYHDRENVYTVLDRTFVVQQGRNPHYHGDFPFQIFRPTIVPQEFVGIGEVEPIAHLQFELNSLRTARRDAATFALHRGYFYAQGMLDPKNAVTGPGMFVPVQGDPREVIYPMPFEDIPQSSVSEAEEIKKDIERTSGISDPVTGAEAQTASSTTATGIQLMQAAAGERIKQKSKNLMLETVRPAAGQWLWLYRQNRTEEEEIRVPAEDAPEGYEFVKVGPRQLNAKIEVIPEGGSQEPDNTAQKRSDALSLLNAMAPLISAQIIDPRRVAKHILEQFDIARPEEWIGKGPGPAGGPDPEQLIRTLGQLLVRQGVDPQVVGAAIQQAAQQLQGAGGAEPGAGNGRPGPQSPATEPPEPTQ